MAEQNYGEIVCEATSVIVEEMLKALHFDQTIIGTIVDDSEKTKGKYRISYNSVVFDAYSANTSLFKGDNVYVQIPNGDWSEQKMILSKKIDKNSEDRVVYYDPFDSFVDITNNLITTNTGQTSLVANGELGSREIWAPTGLNLAKYTRLGIKASFRAWLNEYDTIRGNYGLRLTITGKMDNATEKEDINIVKYCILDCGNMIGNPYNFESYYDQKQLYVIDNINTITSMTLEFFQNKDFLDSSGQPVPHEGLPPNLFVKDIVISLGYDSSEFEDNTLMLYTLDNSSYDATADPDANEKNLQVRWIHKFDNGKIKAVDADDKLPHQLLWYRKRIGVSSDNQYSGVDWERFGKQTVDANGNVTKEGNIPAFNQINLEPDCTLQNEYVKAIIMYGGGSQQPVYSNIIEFNNAKIVPNKTTQMLLTALSINCDDESFGNYFLYNLGGAIVDPVYSQKERNFELQFNPTIGNALLTEAKEIEWIVPGLGSMIELVESYELNEDDKCYHILHKDLKGKPDITNERTLKYRIRSHYNQSYNNNTIRCRVVKDTLTYTASKELTFGPIGTAGTDYTFVLDFEDRATALTINDNTSVVVRARLYDNKGEEINITGKSINWSISGFEGISYASVPDAKDKYELKLKQSIKEIPANNYAIVQATLEEWGDYDLISYLPVPIRLSKAYSISGPTSVCYNSLGTLDSVSFFQNPYQIFEYGKDMVYGEWELHGNGKYIPKLQKHNDRYMLEPLSFYVEEDEMRQVCVVGKKDGVAVWSQPIFITQNKYPSSILNGWNGELKIDNENNAILAAKIAAGKKNTDDNTFSGVMMGDWSGEEVVYEEVQDPNDPNKKIKQPKKINGATETAIAEHTGIYGFYHGAASFGFRDDGTAFIGKPGAGRLEFNGDKSTIESNAFAENKGGMSLDFDDGRILIKNPIQIEDYEINDLKIDLNVSDKATPLKIGESTNPKFRVNWDGSMYATDGHFEGDGEFAGHIEANSGRIGAWHLTGYDSTDASSGALYSSNYDPEKEDNLYGTYLSADGSIKVGQYFSVDNMGNLTASNVNLTGEITAESGKIGAWTIQSEVKDENGKPVQGALYSENTWFYPDGSIKAGSTQIGADGSIQAGTNFSVSADGILTAEGGNFSGSINASEITGSSITGTEINNGNGTFHVDATGHMTATSGEFTGKISGSSIVGTTISNGNGTFYVAEDGTLSATNGYFEGEIGASTLTSPTGSIFLDGYLTTGLGELGYVTGNTNHANPGEGIGMQTITTRVIATETNAGMSYSFNSTESFYVSTSDMDAVLGHTSGSGTGSVRITRDDEVTISGTKLVCNVPASQQIGIYARFA